MANANYIKEQIAKSSAKQQAVSEVTQILKAVLGDNSADYADAVNLIVSAACFRGQGFTFNFLH